MEKESEKKCLCISMVLMQISFIQLFILLHIYVFPLFVVAFNCFELLLWKYLNDVYVFIQDFYSRFFNYMINPIRDFTT